MAPVAMPPPPQLEAGARLELLGERLVERGQRVGKRARSLLAVLGGTAAGGMVRARAASLSRAVASRLRPDPVPEAYVPGQTHIGRLLLRPAALGFLASVAIVLGATQPNSPFTSKAVGSWFFGIPTPSVVPGTTPPPSQWLFVGVVAVYAGMILMLRAWWDIVRLLSRYRGVPVRRLVPVFAAWTLPLLIVAPLFSRDLYSYVAQGEMMSRHINPYLYPPSTLGPIGANPLNRLVDPLWGNVSSPYGPVFLVPAGWIVELTGHNVLASVEGLRLLSLLGTIAFAAAVPTIARSFGRDSSTAFALAALNPLVLLHLVGGGHNDALMLGFLVPGYALARKGHRLWGILLVALGAGVKVPALIGAVYIGWEWLGPGRGVRERVRPVATALLLAVGVMSVLSAASGLGWGWMAGLSNPDTVRSWLDPATGVGLLGGHLVALVGLGNHGHLVLTLARAAGLLLAAAISLRLLLRSDEIGALRALGWSLIAIVILSPVVQPWYASWGFVFLAPVAVGSVRRVVVICSGIACFVGLPGGRVLVDELSMANPALVAVFAFVLVGLGVAMLRRRPVRSASAGAKEPELVAERA
ncbi:MAG: hypothetical protein JWM85_1041 [Acidimicrobiaceae bacterium]|nr:hypothetical protein [Acidimicrobiaceae bacterium]